LLTSCMSCCRFDGHRDWVFHEAGRGLYRDEDSAESSRSRRSSLSRSGVSVAQAARDLVQALAGTTTAPASAWGRSPARLPTCRRIFWTGSLRPCGRTRSGSPTSLHLDRRGLALCVGRHRPVLAPGGRLVDERQHDSPIGCGRFSWPSGGEASQMLCCITLGSQYTSEIARVAHVKERPALERAF
jgi:hypothetical protein